MYIYIMKERTQIYLTREERFALEREARLQGRTKSQLIRDAIDRLYLQPQNAEVVEALTRSHGTWRREQSGAQWVERRRSGRLARLHGVRARGR